MTLNGSVPADIEDWPLDQKEKVWALRTQRQLAAGELTAAQRAVDESWWWNRDERTQALAAARAKLSHIDDQLVGLGLERSREPIFKAGDEALNWSPPRKFYETLKYAYDKGMFKGEIAQRMKDLLETLKDPAALAQFVGMAAGMVALKKEMNGAIHLLLTLRSRFA